MTEKRYVVKDKWIEDMYIGKLLNIDFNTITDAVRCCDLLNDMENKKVEYGKIASEYLEENMQLKAQLKQSVFVNIDGEDLSWAINRLCEFHQYPVGTDKERRAMEIILKELGKENPCKDTFYK